MLFLASGGLAAGAWFAGEPDTARIRLSLVSAWLSFALLVAAVGLGPWQALRTGRPLLNSLLRRDLGIWAALSGLVHLVLGTVVVMRPAYVGAYLTGPVAAPLPGWTWWLGTTGIVIGYLVGVLVLMLLALSNNWSLGRLGSRRWKRLQGAATLAFVLTVAHGVVFQMLEGRTGGWLAGLVVVSTAILLLRRRARRTVAAGDG